MEQEAYFVFVKIPAAIEPLDRGDLFEDPLSEILEREGLGEVTGGGTLLSAPDENGERNIESCGIDVDLYDLDKGLALLKTELRRLNIPLGTTLEFEVNGESCSVAVY